MSLPTLADLKIHLNKTTPEDDDELAEMLDAALDIVTGFVGPIAPPAAATETHYGLSSDVLVLRQMPVAELTAVSSRSGATTTPLTLTDYELDSSTGIVRLASGGRFYGNYTVTYTVGRESVPAAIRLAMLIIAGHLWETQRVPGASRGATQPGFGQPAMPGVPMGFAIPNRAAELLAPYRMPVIA